MSLVSILILFDLMVLTLIWSELIRAFSLLVLLNNTSMALNPKFGLSSGSLITKKNTWSSSTVLLDSSNNSNFVSVHPTSGMSVWLPHRTCSMSHGMSPFKILTLVSYSSTALRCEYFSKKNIEKKRSYRHDKNYYFFCKSNIPVIDLIVGSRNMIKLSKNMTFEKIR